MQVISNGGMRSGEHRVVTNTRVVRTSLATFVMPEMGCTVAPAPELVGDGKPEPLYRPYSYDEFLSVYTSATGDRDAVLGHFKMIKQ